MGPQAGDGRSHRACLVQQLNFFFICAAHSLAPVRPPRLTDSSALFSSYSQPPPAFRRAASSLRGAPVRKRARGRQRREGVAVGRRARRPPLTRPCYSQNSRIRAATSGGRCWPARWPARIDNVAELPSRRGRGRPLLWAKRRRVSEVGPGRHLMRGILSALSLVSSEKTRTVTGRLRLRGAVTVNAGRQCVPRCLRTGGRRATVQHQPPP